MMISIDPTYGMMGSDILPIHIVNFLHAKGIYYISQISKGMRSFTIISNLYEHDGSRNGIRFPDSME